MRTIRKMLGAAIVVALLGAAVAPATEAAAAKKPPADFVGILANDISAYSHDPAYWATQFKEMHRARIAVIRPTLDFNRPSDTLDAFFIQAAAQHLRVLPLIVDSSKYVVPAGKRHGVHPPKRLGALAGYAKGLAKRYGRKGTLWRGPFRRYRRYAVRSWQIWNEPNLPVWWQPRPNPKAYARMTKVVGRAIKRADRRASILSAGIPDSKQSKPRNYKRYLTAFLRAGGGRYVDAVGVHAYARTVSGVKRVLRTYRKVLNAHRGKRVHMVISEVGWASSGHRNPMVVGTRGQAKRVSGLFRMVKRVRRSYKIDGLYYFDWRDYQAPAGDPRASTWGYHTGLIRANGRRKPAFAAFRRGVRALARPARHGQRH